MRLRAAPHRRGTTPRAVATGVLLLGLVAAAPPTGAQAQREAGFDPARLARLDSLFQRYAAEGRIGGAVGLVLRDGATVWQGAAGWADREAGRPMTPDAIFRIASQTKAVTSVAVMILVEEGRLGLNDPVARYLPSFARSMVAEAADSGRVPVAAARPVTIRHLLTHTAGLSYGREPRVAERYAAAGLGPAAGNGWYLADKDEPVCATMDRLGALPLVAQPGERFVYGYATDVLGCVVERASGLPFDRFVRERISGPLGMRDTEFFLRPDQRGRLAAVYAVGGDGTVRRAEPGPRGQGDYEEGPRRNFSGGAGLLSTARDYARFLEMLRRRGELDGVRVLSPRSVELMTTGQIGTRFDPEGAGFGLGFRVVEQAGAGGGFASVGAFGWGGAYNTTYLVDPAQGLVLVFMAQHLPAGNLDLADRFATLVYAALGTAR
jgi:CubicO group peptidase (beta-lactamase class C family)